MTIDDPRNDHDLLAAVRDGDDRAFEVLYRRHRDWAVRLAYRYTRDRHAALDAMQETFLYLLRKAPTLTLTGKLTSFLYPVVKHEAQAARRKMQRHTSVEALPDVAASMHEAGDLAGLIDQLSEVHREVLLMRFVDELSLAQIAEALDLAVGTVKSRLHRAIDTLRQSPAIKNYFN